MNNPQSLLQYHVRLLIRQDLGNTKEINHLLQWIQYIRISSGPEKYIFIYIVYSYMVYDSKFQKSMKIFAISL